MPKSWTQQQRLGFYNAYRMKRFLEGASRGQSKEGYWPLYKSFVEKGVSFESACAEYGFDPILVVEYWNCKFRWNLVLCRPDGSPVDPGVRLLQSAPQIMQPSSLTDVDWVYQTIWKYRAWKDWKQGDSDARPPEVFPADAPNPGAWGLLLYAYSAPGKFYDRWGKEKTAEEKVAKSRDADLVEGVDMRELLERHGKVA